MCAGQSLWTAAVGQAIEQGGVNVRGYYAWSLMDNGPLATPNALGSFMTQARIPASAMDWQHRLADMTF